MGSDGMMSRELPTWYIISIGQSVAISFLIFVALTAKLSPYALLVPFAWPILLLILIIFNMTFYELGGMRALKAAWAGLMLALTLSNIASSPISLQAMPNEMLSIYGAMNFGNLMTSQGIVKLGMTVVLRGDR